MSGFFIRIGIAALIFGVVAGNIFTHPDYSVVSNSISELAAQNMPNAWIMRVAFFVYGLSVAAAALADIRTRVPARIAVIAFGLSLVGAGYWAARPIWLDAPFDLRDDYLHSIFGTLAGVSFAAACSARLFLPSGSLNDRLSRLGLVASIAIPLFMLQFPNIDGLPQRLMFAISALWLWREFRSNYAHVQKCVVDALFAVYTLHR